MSNPQLPQLPSRLSRWTVHRLFRKRLPIMCPTPRPLQTLRKKKCTESKDIPRITSCVLSSAESLARNAGGTLEAPVTKRGFYGASSPVDFAELGPPWGPVGVLVDLGEATGPHFFGRWPPGVWRRTTTPFPRRPSYLGSMEGGIHPSHSQGRTPTRARRPPASGRSHRLCFPSCLAPCCSFWIAGGVRSLLPPVVIRALKNERHGRCESRQSSCAGGPLLFESVIYSARC